MSQRFMAHSSAIHKGAIRGVGILQDHRSMGTRECGVFSRDHLRHLRTIKNEVAGLMPADHEWLCQRHVNDLGRAATVQVNHATAGEGGHPRALLIARSCVQHSLGGTPTSARGASAGLRFLRNCVPRRAGGGRRWQGCRRCLSCGHRLLSLGLGGLAGGVRRLCGGVCIRCRTWLRQWGRHCNCRTALQPAPDYCGAVQPHSLHSAMQVNNTEDVTWPAPAAQA
mmetsp:Transcript_71822/g.166148  ORF Transcript_71822/g.166148 Transcript_71822/m.166148 type:complete len:225 (-) Transcript_71822:669-1343(-)